MISAHMTECIRAIARVCRMTVPEVLASLADAQSRGATPDEWIAVLNKRASQFGATISHASGILKATGRPLIVHEGPAS